MESLQCQLENINFAQKISQVEQIISETKVQVTFWGGRVVTSDAGSGSVSLDVLARKVLRAENARNEKDDLSMKERASGMRIVGKLNGFYDQTDNDVKKCNFITRFLFFIRHSSIVPYTPSWYLSEANTFCRISGERFKKTFGEEPYKDQKTYSFHENLFGAESGGRFYLKKDIIEELASKEA